MLAEVEAAPAKVLPKAAKTSSVVAPFLIKFAKAGSSFFNGPSCPLKALLRASDTAPKSLPVPAEMSSARLSKSWAWVTLLVPLTSLSNAGRSSSSDTAAAIEVWVMNFSTLAICASVAPVVFCRLVANSCAALSSSINAFTASTATMPRPAIAAAAGSAAFLIANWAFSPAVSNFLNSLMALSIPLESKSLITGIEIAIREPSNSCWFPTLVRRLPFQFRLRTVFGLLGTQAK